MTAVDAEVVLRPILERESSDVFQAVVEQTDIRSIMFEELAVVTERSIAQSIFNRSAVAFWVEHVENHEWLGLALLRPWLPSDLIFEMQVGIRLSHRHQGYAQAATALLIVEARALLGARALISMVPIPQGAPDPAPLPPWETAGRLAAHLQILGAPHDAMVYRLSLTGLSFDTSIS